MRLAYNMSDATKFQNWDKIHPLMQLEVFNLIQFLVPHGLRQLIVFGSSIMEERCHVWSDLDIYVEGCDRAIVEEYVPLRDIQLDVLFPYIVGTNSPMRREIERTGVCMYG